MVGGPALSFQGAGRPTTPAPARPVYGRWLHIPGRTSPPGLGPHAHIGLKMKGFRSVEL